MKIDKKHFKDVGGIILPNMCFDNFEDARKGHHC